MLWLYKESYQYIFLAFLAFFYFTTAGNETEMGRWKYNVNEQPSHSCCSLSCRKMGWGSYIFGDFQIRLHFVWDMWQCGAYSIDPAQNFCCMVYQCFSLSREIEGVSNICRARVMAANDNVSHACWQSRHTEQIFHYFSCICESVHV